MDEPTSLTLSVFLKRSSFLRCNLRAGSNASFPRIFFVRGPSESTASAFVFPDDVAAVVCLLCVSLLCFV
jgi:hypothetical protein